MKIIADIWRYVEMASHNPQNDDHPLLKNNVVFIPLQNDLDYGYILETKDRILIMFRGTDGKAEGWLNNFSPYDLKGESEWGKNVVHKGFFESWQNFEKPVKEFIFTFAKGETNQEINWNNVGQIWKDKNLKKIFIGGHSRGANIGSLCAGFIAKMMGISCSCIVFGCPRLGTTEFRDKFNALPIDCLRVINEYDFANDLPPHSLGFRHHGRELILKNPPLHKIFRKIRNHYYSSYTQKIKEYCFNVGDTDGVIAMNETMKQVLV